jgi:hypothetical protein
VCVCAPCVPSRRRPRQQSKPAESAEAGGRRASRGRAVRARAWAALRCEVWAARSRQQPSHCGVRSARAAAMGQTGAAALSQLAAVCGAVWCACACVVTRQRDAAQATQPTHHTHTRHGATAPRTVLAQPRQLQQRVRKRQQGCWWPSSHDAHHSATTQQAPASQGMGQCVTAVWEPPRRLAAAHAVGSALGSSTRRGRPPLPAAAACSCAARRARRPHQHQRNNRTLAEATRHTGQRASEGMQKLQ